LQSSKAKNISGREFPKWFSPFALQNFTGFRIYILTIVISFVKVLDLIEMLALIQDLKYFSLINSNYSSELSIVSHFLKCVKPN